MREFGPRTDATPLDTERILRAFTDAGADFVLIGGIAGVVHGAERETFDADFLPCLELENLERVLAALGALNAGIFVTSARLAMEAGELWETESLRRGAVGLFDAEAWHFATDAGLVDVVLRAAAVGDYDAHQPNAERVELFGMPILVAGIDDLVRSKEHLGRDKDLSIVEQLRRIRDGQPR
ncbi:MAG TPA: hypothetical protein VHC63_01700 [Acidimicrobiales bacterium]|nr:hypothetical protein [Acidimicrobiales bacterium]